MKELITKGLLAFFLTLVLSYLGTFLLCLLDFGTREDSSILSSFDVSHRWASGVTINHAMAFTLVYLPWIFISEKKKRMREFPFVAAYMVIAAWLIVLMVCLQITNPKSSFIAATSISLTYGLISAFSCWLFFRERNPNQTGHTTRDQPPALCLISPTRVHTLHVREKK